MLRRSNENRTRVYLYGRLHKNGCEKVFHCTSNGLNLKINNTKSIRFYLFSIGMISWALTLNRWTFSGTTYFKQHPHWDQTRASHRAGWESIMEDNTKTCKQSSFVWTLSTHTRTSNTKCSCANQIWRKTKVQKRRPSTVRIHINRWVAYSQGDSWSKEMFTSNWISPWALFGFSAFFESSFKRWQMGKEWRRGRWQCTAKNNNFE